MRTRCFWPFSFDDFCQCRLGADTLSYIHMIASWSKTPSRIEQFKDMWLQFPTIKWGKSKNFLNKLCLIKKRIEDKLWDEVRGDKLGDETRILKVGLNKDRKNVFWYEDSLQMSILLCYTSHVCNQSNFIAWCSMKFLQRLSSTNIVLFLIPRDPGYLPIFLTVFSGNKLL